MTELESDASQTYNELASKYGISRLTVASRLRRLFKKDVIKIFCWADPLALGFNISAGLGICTQPGRVNEAADKLAACTQISHVLLVTGRFDIVAWCQFREREELSEFILNELGNIPGIQRVDTQLVLRQVKAYPMLLADNKKFPLFNSVTQTLDELDLKIIYELQKDSKQKPLQLAQKFGVSDTTILRRTKRLVDEKIIRMITYIHPFALGYEGVATIALKCDADKTREVTETISAYKNVQYVSTYTGQYDISIWVVFRNLNDLGNFIEVELRSIPGLRESETMIVHKMVKTSNPYSL